MTDSSGTSGARMECSACEGSGHSKSASGKCQICDGAGTVPDLRVMCPACGGTCSSRDGRGRCMRCRGTGLVIPGEADSRAFVLVPQLGKPAEREGAKPPHIARACLVAAMDVRMFGGARRNHQSGNGWSYADAEEIISLAGDALLPLGVLATVDHVEPQIDGTGQRRLAVTLLLEHPESGEEWSRVVPTAVVWGEDIAQGENAAATSAFAYFLTRVLAIPRGYRNAELALGLERTEDGGGLLQTAPGKGAPAQPTKADHSMVATAFANDVSAARSVAELAGVEAKIKKAMKRNQIGNADIVMLDDLVRERRLVCQANDAGRAHEGPQRGQAA